MQKYRFTISQTSNKILPLQVYFFFCLYIISYKNFSNEVTTLKHRNKKHQLFYNKNNSYKTDRKFNDII